MTIRQSANCLINLTPRNVLQALKNGLKNLKSRENGSQTKFLIIGMLREINVIMPPIQMQDIFEKLAIPIYRKQQNNSQQNQQLASLRDWLLPMLMNGQVSVGEARERSEEVLDEQAESLGRETPQTHLFT
jgi:type I restriction enzyme S subunit